MYQIRFILSFKSHKYCTFFRITIIYWRWLYTKIMKVIVTMILYWINQFVINKFPVQPYFNNIQMFLLLTCVIRSKKLYTWLSGKQFRFISIMYCISEDCVVLPEPRTSSLFTKQIKFNGQNYLKRSVLFCIKNSCLLELLTIFSTKSLIFIQFPLPRGK